MYISIAETIYRDVYMQFGLFFSIAQKAAPYIGIFTCVYHILPQLIIYSDTVKYSGVAKGGAG